MTFLAELKHKIHQFGLLELLDRVKFWYYQRLNNSSNQDFRKDHPDIVLPPDYMLFEAYGLNYRSYYEGGLETAKWILDTLNSYIDISEGNILDWGCGPARVVRHMPTLLPNSQIFGTDYNIDSIKWCLQNIPDVRFQKNQVSPPLDYPPKFFDAIYGISIITHLSRSSHETWIQELHRILKDFGILLITSQGAIHLTKLSSREREVFRKGEIVVRDGIKEGHRTYSAFQPEMAMRKLLAGYFEVLLFIPGQIEKWGLGQDVWVLKKK